MWTVVPRLSQSLITDLCQLEQKYNQHMDVNATTLFMLLSCFDLICFLSVTYMTPVQDLISDPPVQCIVEVANLLDLEDEKGGDWPRLWQELMHKFPNEAVVRHNKRGPTIFLLKTWCQIKLPSVATVGELVNALKAVNRADVALIIEKYCEVRTFIQ